MNEGCIKVAYASRGEATKEAGKARLMVAKPYLCGICGAWHFSSGQTKQREHRKRVTRRGGKRKPSWLRYE